VSICDFHRRSEPTPIYTEVATRMPDEYEFVGRTYRCIAIRRDLYWGHGLKITRHDDAGAVLDILYAVCHPEWDDFDEMQALSTSELVEVAREMLEVGDKERRLQSCREVGLRLGFTLSRLPGPERRLRQWVLAPSLKDLRSRFLSNPVAVQPKFTRSDRAGRPKMEAVVRDAVA
jgi:hypothetical protein